MNDHLLRVLKCLEQKNIQYCLLRDQGSLDQLANGVEVDLLVQDIQLAQLSNLLAGLGFVGLPSQGYAPHHFFVAYDRDSDRWIKLDVVTEIAYGKPVRALRTALAIGCLGNRRRCGSTFVPAPEDELVMLLLHCVLDKGDFAPSRRQRLKALRYQVTDGDYFRALLATYWSPTMTWPQIAALIEAEDWTALLAERAAVAARLASRDPIGTLGRQARDRALRKMNRWAGLLRPRVPTVALLAPDGAGKTTLAAGIRNSFYFPVRLMYMGLYQKGAARSVALRLPGLGLTSRLLTQWKRYLTARYHQARGRLVVFDRYTYDAWLPPRQRLTWLRRWRRWLLGHACPAPDMVLVLDAPGEVLYARSGEHGPAVLEQQRQAYLQLQSYLPQTVVVDVSRDAEHVRREVTALIWQSLPGILSGASRNGHTNGDDRVAAQGAHDTSR